MSTFTTGHGYALGAVPRYRLVFPPEPGEAADQSPTAHVDSGKEVYDVGSVVVHHGKRWRVSQAPLELPGRDEADVMLWPEDP